MAADFARLYAELGVDARCGIDDFRHACRRRIGDLHPDRPDATAAGDAGMPLDELLALYTAAVQFHQKYGRLPGAPAVAFVEHRPAAPMSDSPAVPAAVMRATTSHRWPMLVLVGSIVLLVALAWSRTVAVAPDAGGSGEAAERVAIEPPAASERLELGMDRAMVAAIQGEPLRIDGGQWEYGPSWLRFEEGALVDWYSSPLHPLETPTPRPD